MPVVYAFKYSLITSQWNEKKKKKNISLLFQELAKFHHILLQYPSIFTSKELFLLHFQSPFFKHLQWNMTEMDAHP